MPEVPAFDGELQSVPAEASQSLPLPPAEAVDGWDQLKRRFSTLLREESPDAAWLVRLREEAARLRTLAARDADLALYLLVQMGASEPERYSAHHSMLCAVVCELAARWLDWPESEVQALVLGALTMNLSMSVMQDALVQQVTPLSMEQRQGIEDHPQRSAELLQAAGVQDETWLAVVRHHHDDPGSAVEPSHLAPARRLASLLRRADVYTAQLSRRITREPRSPSIAARDACLDSAGLPDAVGATLLRVLGLYPPGSCVLLANGEYGVVVRRGGKAHTPLVAAVRRDDGGVFMQPPRRDTSLRGCAVVRGATEREMRVRLHHARVLAVA